MAQDRGYRELGRLPQVAPGVARAPLETGALVGRVDIARLNLSAIVFEGTADHVLSEGVGHMPGTALPGQNGNIVLAAHRDTFFRALRNIHSRDMVTVSTPAGLRRYQVEWTRVVSPFDTEVAAPTEQPALTLITCYPFEFFGHAPERFVVRAREVTDAQPAVAEPVRVQTPRPRPRRIRPAQPAVPPPAPRVTLTSVSMPAPPAVHLAALPAPAPEAATEPDPDPPPPPPAPARHRRAWMHPVGLVKKLVHR